MEDKHIKYAREVVGGDPMATYLGIKVEEVSRAYARLSLFIRPEYLNALDRAHGIAISSLIDQAVAVASNSTEFTALIVELKINYLQGVSPGETIVAEASPLDFKNKLSLWQVVVRDSHETQVALAQALAYHQKKNRS